MAEMIPWRFLIFTAIFAAMFYCQFYLAHRQWLRLKGEQATEIDVNYVRSENYFGQSFRVKVKDWLTIPPMPGQDGTTILKGDECIRVIDSMELPAGSDCDDILVVERNFACAAGSRLRREVLVHGDAEIGPTSRVQSIAADGSLFLGEDVRVARWLDATGELTLSSASKVQSRVTSQKRISLGLGVEVGSAYAPEVATAGTDGGFERPERKPAELLDLVLAEQSEEGNQKLAALGFKRDRLIQLGADTWLYKGDLRLPVAVRIRKKLAVTGTCVFRAGSRIEADLKAGESIFVGPGCAIDGNLVAEKHIFIGSDCRFSNMINAGRSLLLSSGTRGFREDGMVVAYAGEKLNAESNVALRGKLCAGERVLVVNAAQSKAWKMRLRIDDDGSPADTANQS